jgi:hypothetical protein
VNNNGSAQSRVEPSVARPPEVLGDRQQGGRAAETHFFRKKGGETLRTTGEATTAKLAATRAQAGKQSPDAAQKQLARIVAGKNDPKKTK